MYLIGHKVDIGRPTRARWRVVTRQLGNGGPVFVRVACPHHAFDKGHKVVYAVPLGGQVVEHLQ